MGFFAGRKRISFVYLFAKVIATLLSVLFILCSRFLLKFSYDVYGDSCLIEWPKLLTSLKFTTSSDFLLKLKSALSEYIFGHGRGQIGSGCECSEGFNRAGR